MANRALGLIETEGFVAMVVGADSALKSADVKLLGYQIVHRGLVSVVIEGNVDAVSVAVNVGVYAAKQVGTVFSWTVMPRPYDVVSQMVDPLQSSRDVSARNEEDTERGHEVFESLSVVELRQRVRLLKQNELTGRQISRANKAVLLRILREYTGGSDLK